MDVLDEFDSVLFENKLTNLKDTQDSIQAVSTWCLQNRSSHKKIVSSWLNVLKQVKIDHRLTLFYLANDVIQYSKRKNYEFVESWGTTLQRATTMVRDEKIKHKILRIFQIWEQRGIYNEEFLTDLNGLLSISTIKKQQAQLQKDNSSDDDFQPTILVSNVRDCVKLEKNTDKSINTLKKKPIPDLENIVLKDREQVDDVDKEIDESLCQFEVVIKCLHAEIKARCVLIAAIEQADTFYNTQRGEVKVVTNAYRNFGNRIKNMKKKLEELQTTLPSPIPSPDINAPSPEPDNDFVLPDETDYFAHQSHMMSYIGSKLPFDISDFNTDSTQNYEKDSAQPIQVINSRPPLADESNFDINDFFKTYLTDAYPSSGGGGGGPQPVPPVTNYVQNSYQATPVPVPNPNYSLSDDNIPNYNIQDHQSINYSNQLPLLPPPMPPSSLDHNEPYNPASWDDGNLAWNSSQDSNNFDELMETPVSPPHFERKGLNESVVEYIDGENNIGISGGDLDIDHRQLTLPNIDESVLNELDIGRGVDVDHRNLISLTGSPSLKSSSEDMIIPPPPKAPPILWTGTDMDFRQQMQMPPPVMTQSKSDKNEVDQDYRVPPLHATTSEANTTLKQSVMSTPPPNMPLEPPPLHDMDEFLKNTLKDFDFELPPPKQIPSNISGRLLKPLIKSGVLGKNGPDNVESIDMDMSDDDHDNNEELMMQLQQLHTPAPPPPQFPNQFMNNSMMRSPPNMNHGQRPPLLSTPKFGGVQGIGGGPTYQKPSSPWMNNSNNMRNDNWEGPPQSPTLGFGGGPRGQFDPSFGPRGQFEPRGQFDQRGQFDTRGQFDPRGQFDSPQNRPFSPQQQMNNNNFRGGGGNQRSPYFRPQRGNRGGRGQFRGNNNRGGMW